MCFAADFALLTIRAPYHSIRRIIATCSEGRLFIHSKEFSPVVARAEILVYFLKPAGVEVAMGSIADSVQYGMISGAGMFTLLRLMSGVYGPQILENNTAWPESIKKDFTGHFHKFMASLTETANESQGKTVLYLPSSLTSFDLEEVAIIAKNKDMVQQLESVVIQWTRQIKQVVNNHDNAYNAEVSGPLEEIGFWRSRTVDLSGISSQLQREDVHKVVAILAAAKVCLNAPVFSCVENTLHRCT
jgi:dynein heavy chain